MTYNNFDKEVVNKKTYIQDLYNKYYYVYFFAIKTKAETANFNYLISENNG